MIRVLFLAVLVAALLAVAPSAAARAAAPKPLRSGTIEGGTGVIFAGGQPAGERWGCEYAAECRTWLESGCNPALAGHDRALTASIVDVGALADGRTGRSFRWTAPYLVHPGAVIQFWGRSCTEVPGSERHTHNPYRNACGTCEAFPIPLGAKWMTVSANWTSAHITWTLT